MSALFERRVKMPAAVESDIFDLLRESHESHPRANKIMGVIRAANANSFESRSDTDNRLLAKKAVDAVYLEKDVKDRMFQLLADGLIDADKTPSNNLGS
jgi:hypothetical protein